MKSGGSHFIQLKPIFGHKLSSTSLKYTTAHTFTFIIPGNRTGHHTEFQTSLSKYEEKKIITRCKHFRSLTNIYINR